MIFVLLLNVGVISTVCSCTLWIGHLNKQTLEKDLSELIEKYGRVTNVFVSISLLCGDPSAVAVVNYRL